LLSVLTINAALQDVRILSFSFYRPLDHIHERLHGLASAIKSLQPDIVCIQELFHHDLQQALYAHLADVYPHATGFGGRGIKWQLDNELITLSRYPFSGSQFIRFKRAATEEKIFIKRGMMRMDMDIPSVGPLQLINVHMTAGGLRQHPEDVHMETVRSSQIRQLLDSVSTTTPAMIVGDFNTGPGSSPENYAQLLKDGMIDTFVAAGGEGMSWDPENPLVAGRCPHGLPPQRVDHILINHHASKILAANHAEIVLAENCLSVADKQIPVSDHYGVLVNFEITGEKRSARN